MYRVFCIIGHRRKIKDEILPLRRPFADPSLTLRISSGLRLRSSAQGFGSGSEWQKSRTLCYRSGWHEKGDWHKKILSYPSFNKITFSDMKKESDTKKLRITLPENIKKKFLHHPFELLLFLFSYTIHFWMCKLSLNLPLDWLSALVLF